MAPTETGEMGAPGGGRLLIVTHQLPWVCALSHFSAKSNASSLYPSLPRSVARRLHASQQQTAAPVPKGKTEIQISQRRGHSALFSGVRSLVSHPGTLLHIGWSGYILDEDGLPIDLDPLSPPLQAQIQERLLDEKQCVAVMYNNRLATGHYDGYCKSDLWPIFHYHM
jgi:trehalose-6-phosphate synthase